MTHYVLLKLAEGTNVDFVESKVRKVYEELAEELDYLHNPVTYRCCVARDSNADIMSEFMLDSEKCLEPYLKHPKHMQMAMDLKDVVIERVSFDHF